ncbi:unnamed protein product [Pleuronectes platessa]|uniref:Uncharacterized protein n=1 Tax=Pleuronectes platessa TaxID=8262 RepID=A0A9N7VNA8_PLEPL|nr:unnamed protein product [Pleuronectes platessa]
MAHSTATSNSTSAWDRDWSWSREDLRQSEQKWRLPEPSGSGQGQETATQSGLDVAGACESASEERLLLWMPPLHRPPPTPEPLWRLWGPPEPNSPQAAGSTTGQAGSLKREARVNPLLKKPSRLKTWVSKALLSPCSLPTSMNALIGLLGEDLFLNLVLSLLGSLKVLSLVLSSSLWKDSPTHDLTINFDNSVLTPTQTARNLGVTLDSQLSPTANITATTRSCRFMLYNIRGIRPLLGGAGSGHLKPRLL